MYMTFGKNSFVLILLSLVMAVFSNKILAIDISSQPAALNQIQLDFESSEISLDEKVLLEVAAIRNPEKLPTKYQILSSSTNGNRREPTIILKEIMENWDILAPGTQQSITQSLARFSTAFTYDTPSGFFKIHYDVTGTHAVSSADTNFNSVPDFVERIAAYCDSSWSKHLALGFLEPPPDGGLGGNDMYDVYFENMGFYGYAVPEGNGSQPWNDKYSYLVLHKDFTIFPPNDDPEGDVLGAAKVTVAHEYHHAIQFGYDASESSWFMELDATYTEDIIFDQTDDNYNYLGTFMNTPAKSLMENSNHSYSSFIWGLYLAQKFDTSLMLAAWEGARYADIFATVSDTLMGRYGWTQDSAMAEFATWNFVTSTRNDFLHHEEASNYPLINIGQSFSSFPVSLRNSPDSPAGYGSNYIQFFPGASDGTLKIMFDGANSREWAAYVIKSTDINTHEFEKMDLNPGNWNDTIQIPSFEDYYSVTLVGINVTEFSAGAFFSYWAQVVQPHGVSTTLLPMDTVIYSGKNRLHSFKVTNPTEYFDVYIIQYWDDLGWITPDSITRSIAPFAESTYTVGVHPPQGTPLGTQAQLNFKATSLVDPSTIEEQILAVTTVLYKGDANFDGSISILDLTYFVNYFFRFGPAPTPIIQSGDFNCDENTNILDLNRIVNYIFRSGPGPTCNPY